MKYTLLMMVCPGAVYVWLGCITSTSVDFIHSKNGIDYNLTAPAEALAWVSVLQVAGVPIFGQQGQHGPLACQRETPFWTHPRLWWGLD